MGTAAVEIDLLGVGLAGPGLPGWAASLPVLRGEQAHAGQPTVVPPPTCLPPAERRRAGLAVRAAIAVAEAACAHAGLAPAALASVFTSSSGDGGNCHSLCESLAAPDPLVSPTRFTNSVHNAAAGYWHIAVTGRQASTSLCAFDASFDAGLTEAVMQVLALRQPVLLVACDAPYPQPLQAVRPLPDAMGVALVLAPGGTSAQPLARLRLALQPDSGEPAEAATACADAGLDALRVQIPAARALPLLVAVARGEAVRVVLPGSGTGAGTGAVRLHVDVMDPA